MDETKVALVTGAGQGIGRAVAGRFVDDGFRVVLLELDPEAGAEVEAELSARGEVRLVVGDVASEADVARAAQTARQAFGRLDALANVAGIMVRKPVAELTLDEWNRVLSVNLTGAFLCAKACAGDLRRTRGAIVNVASTRARMSEPDTEAYAASKGGIVALTHALAISLGPEVRVNCVSPGWIEVGDWKKRADRTEPELTAEDHAQHPVGRVGRPGDVAALVAWLCSDEAGFVTGADHVVDGGMTRKMIYAE